MRLVKPDKGEFKIEIDLDDILENLSYEELVEYFNGRGELPDLLKEIGIDECIEHLGKRAFMDVIGKDAFLERFNIEEKEAE